MDLNEEFITSVNNKFIVHRKFDNTDYIFGEFNNLSDAIEFRDNINNDGWPIKKNMKIFNNKEKNMKKKVITEFFQNHIIISNQDVEIYDPSIDDIYYKFKEFSKNQRETISLSTFKYYMTRLLNKKSVKKEFINGKTRYSIHFHENNFFHDLSSNNNTFQENKNNHKLFNNIDGDCDDHYTFNIKVGKAYKHKFLVLTRCETYELLPKLDYEDECDIIFDGIKAKAKLNIVPRIVIKRDNVELLRYLKSLSDINPEQRKNVFLIKKDSKNSKEFSSDIKKENNELKEENKKLKEENTILKKKIKEINTKINELSKLINIDTK